MVNINIPENYTASPSSFMGSSSLTINHEATLDLDSSNAFEGPEKLLEVWFGSSPKNLLGSTEPTGLKAVPAEIWKDMLDLVSCKVLSIIESDDVDAYLLSESSMFVFPHKLILKTCGTTTLLSGLPRILEIAALYAGFPKNTTPASCGIATAAAPYRVFYSRKNFLFPDRQRGPHRSWRDEVKTMDQLFLGGSAYMIGKMNGEHWYLYLTEPYTILTPPSTPGNETPVKVLEFPEHSKTAARSTKEEGENDETLEILMTDLDEENAKQFYLDHASAVAEGRHRLQRKEKEAHDDEHLDVFSNNSDTSDLGSDMDQSLPSELTTEGHGLGTVVSESCGLSDIYPTSQYPGARVDAYLFTPCGFSANGVVPAPNGSSGSHYFTVHVTPEPHCSYASFETNVPQLQSGRETSEIVDHVVDIFKPGRFSVTLFEAKKPVYKNHHAASPATATTDGAEVVSDILVDEDEHMNLTAAARNAKMERIPGYRRVDRIVHELDGYDLVFRYYERNDWRGGAPRIGESAF
ncbi:S-adenosylmethionine decarboxylase proenzyme [Paracoccidioides brasiliensis Pb18]|uniref:adenosylmethionine decarboxylase n=2 Tax=Paracoccidioides brasiliensis TaxID=121759 RepID=C1GJS5_PARBD|nr:S-adenosylmethionine decarboxylase proenzyme [Paracoccidioides brasiliensis Pb18]EEH42691.1 S-adenosylmethionine decarboxylase proenzyme [Paracoccidioides brasiliensis Pb18]ODH43087.1 S-adenosylmethionine decarboxylase proenzyme [Paracoccidioides brasiliensis]